MKRFILSGAVLLAATGIYLSSHNASQRELTKLERANIEALAGDDEAPWPVACLGPAEECYLNGSYRGPYLTIWSDGSKGLD